MIKRSQGSEERGLDLSAGPDLAIPGPLSQLKVDDNMTKLPVTYYLLAQASILTGLQAI